MDKEVRIAYLETHLAVFLWGFTAIIGKWISLSEVPLVLHRMWLTTLCLLFIPGVIKGLRTLSAKDFWIFVIVGFLIAFHWVFFYGAIKYSNASIALCGLATTSLFTSFLEPLFFKKKIRPVEVFLGLVVILGIFLIFNTSPTHYNLGFGLGLTAAVLAAIFSILNKKYVHRGDPKSITAVEMGSGFLILTLLLPVYIIWFPQARLLPNVDDWILLFIMSAVCTAFPMVISLRALKHISAFASSIALNLEPIYGMIMAWLIFNENEELSPYFYFGALMIIGSVLLHPLLESNRLKNKVKILMGRS
ncbi:MAG: DMT family transporter [Bacteroidota bacterium]